MKANNGDYFRAHLRCVCFAIHLFLPLCNPWLQNLLLLLAGDSFDSYFKICLYKSRFSEKENTPIKLDKTYV